MANKKRKNKKARSGKRKSNAMVIWGIILVSLLIIGYFTYPQIKPWFTNGINKDDINSSTHTEAKNSHELTKNVWVNELDGSMLSLKSNGSFMIDFPSVEQSRQLTGTWQVQNNSISIEYSDHLAMCDGKPGSYQYNIEGDALSFKEIKDACKNRKDLLTSGWFRL